MDGWAVLLGLVYGSIAVSSLALAVFVGWQVVQAVRQGQKGDRRKMLIALALAVAPFVAFYGYRFAQDTHAGLRANALAQLPREDVEHNYPRTLEVYTQLGDASAAALLASGTFSAIYDVESRRYPADESARVYRYALNGCQVDDARAWMALRRRGALTGAHMDWRLSHCVSRVYVEGYRFQGEALILLTDHATTLHEGNTLWAGGNFEVRARRGGEDKLVDYWERLHYERPISPLLVSPAGYVSQSADNDEPMTAFAVLLGAIDGVRPPVCCRARRDGFEGK